MRFSLSVEAEEDIIAFTEQGIRMFGSVQARRYHDDLFAVLELIAANPRMALSEKRFRARLGFHPFKADLIVYRIEENGTIFVIRIRHGHEDWASKPA